MSSDASAAGKRPLRVDVVVLGASFAGVELVLQLRRRADLRKLSIAVVDRQSEHGYIPLCHERLCRRLHGEPTALSTAERLQAMPRVRFVHDEVVGFDPKTKVVALGSGGKIRGRFVVIALGSTLSAPPELPGAEHLHSIKLAEGFERASARLAELLTEGEDDPAIAVVGGGISGVELAGELAHLRAQRPSEWAAPRVTLVSASRRLLPELRQSAARRALRSLQGQGVDVRLGARVTAVADDGLQLDEGGQAVELPANITFWAGGVRPAPILADLGVPTTESGWLRVGPSLQCFATAKPTHPDIFGCGDAVRIVGGEGPWPTMVRAIECIWQAKTVATNIAILAAEPKKYPQGVPPLRPHACREHFPYGVSLGARSLIVYRAAVLDVPPLGVWFRRFLMRRYFERYDVDAARQVEAFAPTGDDRPSASPPKSR